MRTPMPPTTINNAATKLISLKCTKRPRNNLSAKSFSAMAHHVRNGLPLCNIASAAQRRVLIQCPQTNRSEMLLPHEELVGGGDTSGRDRLHPLHGMIDAVDDDDVGDVRDDCRHRARHHEVASQDERTVDVGL